MKILSLYIDKWYIVGAVSTDGITRAINLPNKEDRIWLYFYEDVASDEVSYGKGFQSKYRNNENHYYGDVFSLVTDSSAKYIKFRRPQPIIGIFKDANIFNDIRNSVDEEGSIETYISFSKDISLAARNLFIEELVKERFVVKQDVARIGHLALEYAAKKSLITEDGYYLILNACNENLYYALYQRESNIFVRGNYEDQLIGMGTDVRSRTLIEHIVDAINDKEHFLQTEAEREYEYLRMAMYVDEWLIKLNACKTRIPVQLTGITLSKDPHKQYSVQVKKAKIDERTDKIVKDIVDVVVKFIKNSNLTQEQIKGILFLGNTFTNSQFKKELSLHYNLQQDKLINFSDTDLPAIVGAYSFMDCSQFSAIQNQQRATGEAELRRIQQLEEEAAAAKKAKEEAEALQARQKEIDEADRNFNNALEKGYNAEKEQNYSDMAEYFSIALNLRPDDEEAKRKYDDALRKKAELTVIQNKYKEKIQEAKNAFDAKDWENAKQKSEEALGFMPESTEAKRIKNESTRFIQSTKELERYIDRCDMFYAQKAYKEAIQELEKAKLLGIDTPEINEREEKIFGEQKAAEDKIREFISDIDKAITAKDFQKALQTCDDLMDLDYANSRKWSAKRSDIKILQQKSEEEQQRYNQLINAIDGALFSEDWERLVSLCREALNISGDANIKEKLVKGEEKLRIQNVKVQLETKVNEIHKLINDNDFSSAKKQLKLIEGTLDTDKVKYLRSLIFNKEDEAERAASAKTKTPTRDDGCRKVVKGFSNSSNKTKTVEIADDDFFNSPSPKKPMQPAKRPTQPKKADSFFDDEDFGNRKAVSSNKHIKGHLANEDFNF